MILLKKSNFPSSLKKANITPVFKKKVTEILRITTDQSAYFQICLKYLNDVFFVHYTVLCLNSCQNTKIPFGKGYSTQHCLLALFQKLKTAVDKGKSSGALLTDLSKA